MKNLFPSRQFSEAIEKRKGEALPTILLQIPTNRAHRIAIKQ
jgi:hypothetical protein